MSKEITKFRIYIPKTIHRNYYEIFVFKTYKDMYEYYKNTGGYQDTDFAAICRDMDIYKGNIPKSKIGEILITKKGCKMGIITHECGHMAFQVIRRHMKESMWTTKDHKWEGEEFYCYFLGEFSRKFVNSLYKYGILKGGK